MSTIEETGGSKGTMVPLPEGLNVTVNQGVITVSGPKGSVARKYPPGLIGVSVSGRQVSLEGELVMRNTFAAHLRNMFTGVAKGFSRKMKALHLHFPISMEVHGDKLLIKNFIGEKQPRESRIPKGVKMTNDKGVLSIEGIDKEKVGEAVANIRTAVKIRKKDSRVFQDGIYEIREE